MGMNVLTMPGMNMIVNGMLIINSLKRVLENSALLDAGMFDAVRFRLCVVTRLRLVSVVSKRDSAVVQSECPSIPAVPSGVGGWNF